MAAPLWVLNTKNCAPRKSGPKFTNFLGDATPLSPPIMPNFIEISQTRLEKSIKKCYLFGPSRHFLSRTDRVQEALKLDLLYVYVSYITVSAVCLLPWCGIHLFGFCFIYSFCIASLWTPVPIAIQDLCKWFNMDMELRKSGYSLPAGFMFMRILLHNETAHLHEDGP